MTTLLGLSAGTAYALARRITGDRSIPVARAATPKKGGVVRISMRVAALRQSGDLFLGDRIPTSPARRTST